MFDLTHAALGILGFFVGLSFWTQFTRWVVLMATTGSKHGGDFLGPPRRRLLWAVPFVAVLHPVPWRLGAGVIASFMSFHNAAGFGWTWFFGGLWLGVLLMALTTAVVLARVRRVKTSSPRQNS